MEQMRKMMDEDAIAESMKQLERTGKYSVEKLKQVKDDYRYGLTRQEVDVYLKKNFSVKQMQMISKALRTQGIELAEIIAKEDIDYHCMQVAIEFYEKGVPLVAISESVIEKRNAHALRYLYQKILSDIKQTESDGALKKETLDASYVEQMLEEMKKIVLQINHNDEKYETLSKKIHEMGAIKHSDEELDELYKRLEEKDLLINSQQDNIQQANAAVARLRHEVDEKEKEMEKLKDTIENLKTEMGQQAANDVAKSDEKVEGFKMETEDTKSMIGTVKGQYPLVYGIPVQYAATVKDDKSNTPVLAMIERTEPKQFGLHALIGKLAYKKKSRQDIVKLVASGDLKTEQLVQIRMAMQKGLTENQLLDLINNNVPAEQMKEIIEIAVLENSLQ